MVSVIRLVSKPRLKHSDCFFFPHSLTVQCTSKFNLQLGAGAFVVTLVSTLTFVLSFRPCLVERVTARHLPSMKALGPRFSFYAGFVVGTFTLYVFLRQVWFERSLSEQQASGFDKLHVRQQQLEEERTMWKKDRSALFSLKHPHHTGNRDLTVHSASQRDINHIKCGSMSPSVSKTG